MPFLRNKFVKIIVWVLVACAVLSGMAYFGNKNNKKKISFLGG